MGRNTRKDQSQDKVNDSEINGKQRQSTKVVTKTILAIVIAMLFAFVTLFLLFNFVCPTNPTGSDASYALSSSTTYYKSGSSFYTRSSATYYKCTNSSHSGTNKYSSSSDLSGTCYTRSGTCSRCNGTGSRTQSTYHSCSKTENVTCSTCGGSKSVSVACSNSSCSGGYVSSTCGTCSGSGQVTCDACKGKGYTTYKSSSEWWDEDHGCPSCGGSGATSVWNTGNYVKGTGKVDCSSCTNGIKKTKCGTCGGSGSLSQSCSTCSATGSVSQTCSTCSGKGYYYTYSTVSCSKTQTNYYDHSVSSYVEYTYTNIDTGSTTTTTTSYSTATGYTVSFNANGGSGSMASQYFLHSHSQTLNANTFTRENYKFKGWATSAYGAVVYNNNHNVKNLATTQGAKVNLYAVWEAVTVTLTFSAQGANNFGTVMLDVTYDSALPTIIIPTRTGYLFKGYYVGSDKIFDETGHPVPAKSTFTTDTTLTASFLRWFEVVSVTGASTTYTVYDNADADIRNSILTFQPAEGYVITSFSFDNVTWYDIEKCEQTLLNTSAAVGVTYCASTGGRALAIEFRGIFTHDVKIYLMTAAGEYTDLSVK